MPSPNAPHTLMVHIRDAATWLDADRTARAAIAVYTKNTRRQSAGALDGHMRNAVYDLIQNPNTGLWSGTCTVTV